jgi:hypothetical protein
LLQQENNPAANQTFYFSHVPNRTGIPPYSEMLTYKPLTKMMFYEKYLKI